MSRYARLAGRRKHPGRKKGRVVPRVVVKHYEAGETIKETEIVCAGARINGMRKFIVPPEPEAPGGADQRLVAVGSKINGVVKSAISPEILKQTEGMPWHRRCARIAAITGKPFTEVTRLLDEQNLN